jgi:DNA-directed RNA polymerase specialized sigma24 family protein
MKKVDCDGVPSVQGVLRPTEADTLTRDALLTTLAHLSDRQVRVLLLCIFGYTQQRIADALGCSVATVCRDVKRIKSAI